ncbi:MAG: twin-arginine translocation signal domain-containing protein [bacterium]|nr:twin-arginine translocation signal domain-containing protein [bacterium]
MMKKWDNELLNIDRRRFLKILAMGGGVLAIGKIYNFFTQNRIISETDFKNFKMVETGKELKFSDEEGAEILIIDKDGI